MAHIDNKHMKTGLLEQIKHATSVAQVESLLAQGKSFRFAATATRRRWAAAATKRVSELNTVVNQ